MTAKNLLLVSVAIAGSIAAAWFGWRWVITPVPPAFPLAQMDPDVAEKIGGALKEVQLQPRSGESWGRLAMAAAANGYNAQSIACFGHAEQLDSANPRWPYLHGLQLKEGRPGEPFPLWRRALECDTTPEQRGAILFRLALALIEDGQVAEAERHLQALRSIEGDSARVHLGLGLLDMARDDALSARNHLTEVEAVPYARKLATGHLATLADASGDVAFARSYQQRRAQLPADLAWPDVFVEEINGYAVNRDRRVREAAELQSAGRFPEAVALLRQTIASTPDASAYLALGMALTKMQQFDEAEEVLSTALRLDPQQMYGHHNLATILFIKAEKLHVSPGGNDRALALFRQVVAGEDRALAIKAHDPYVHLTRGRALRYLGRTDDALQALRAAAQCGPGLADVHLVLGEALGEAGLLPEALAHLEDAVRLAGPQDRALYEAALTKWRAGASTLP